MFASKTRQYEREMRKAGSYAEWKEAATRYESAQGLDRWKRIDTTRSYDYVAIRLRLDRLRSLRSRHDYPGLLFNLNEGIHGNLGGMGRPVLYQRAKFGTKQLIVDYVDEVVDALEVLADPKRDEISDEEKLDFFRRADHCFGHSALMMSGSGMLLYFHLGVVKALWQEGLLPDILSGASGGSFVGSLVATHTDEELQRIFDPKYLAHELEVSARMVGRFEHLRPKILEVDEIRQFIEQYIPDLTFLESYEKTGRSMNISIAPSETHQTSRLLNATTTPNVLIRESIMASCAVPGIYPPVILAARNKWGEKQQYLPLRKWVDGSVSDDLPAKRLARLYGVNHYIVSQTNPHVIPFIRDTSRGNSPLSVIRYTSIRTAREWLNAGATIFHRPLSRQPRLHQVTTMVLSVLNHGRLLARLSQREITRLIDMGERATWPKIETIRIQTKISRTLRRVRAQYELQPAPKIVVGKR
jgi:TAG lipase/steryl ester hydrolase/phospholipase A2/LPA acyltransferase